LKRIEVAAPIPVRGPLSYLVPDSLESRIRPGQRVRIRVGRSKTVGVVWTLPTSEPAERELRPIEALLDVEPILPEELLDLARFVADYYLAPIGEVVAAMVPADLPPWGDRTLELTAAGAIAEPRDKLDRLLRDVFLAAGRLRAADLAEQVPDADLAARVQAWIASGRLHDLGSKAVGRAYTNVYSLVPAAHEELLERCGRSPGGRSVVELLRALGRPAGLEELQETLQVGEAVVRRLARIGVLRSHRQAERASIERHLLSPRAAAGAPQIELRGEQQEALAAVEEALARGAFHRILLHGITGSGKTEVYLRAAAATLAGGRTAILMVPEIALVPALARAALDRFGPDVAVLHSGLSRAERASEWERLRTGEARIVVGPRSALFAPVPRLGLIVVDEEQDAAYKQEVTPRYHGRDLALVRCQRAGAVALLVSATPSLEARHAAGRSGWSHLRLTERVGVGRLPEGVLVDLRKEPRTARAGEILFSDRLVTEMNTAFSAGQQVLLLRNRRGYAPMLLCRACGEDFRCPDCGLPRTLHRRDRRLTCHWCGSTLPAPSICPVCRSEALDPIGAGTERVEEDLARLFPGVACGVLDRDSTRRIGSAAAILERFRSGQTRILVGTQMLSKGHHFPNVVLTAVLSADTHLGFPDFRAVERTYVLLTQLAGRAGRGREPGRVLIQTYHPEHYAIRAALEHDDEGFAAQELRFRKLFDYPPFTRMAMVWIRDKNRQRGGDRIAELADAIRKAPSAAELRISHPAPAPLERLKGEWRFQLAVRGRSSRAIHEVLGAALGNRIESGLVIDVDPYQLL